MFNYYLSMLGKHPKKKIPNYGKSPKGRGGVSSKNQKVQNSKFGLFDKRGGGVRIFIFFPNVNAHFRYFSWRENKVVLKWFLGNFKCFKLKFHVLRGVPKIQSFPNFKFFQRRQIFDGNNGFLAKFYPFFWWSSFLYAKNCRILFFLLKCIKLQLLY